MTRWHEILGVKVRRWCRLGLVRLYNELESGEPPCYGGDFTLLSLFTIRPGTWAGPWWKLSWENIPDDDGWWGLLGRGGRLIILILSFDWVTVLTFGSSPVLCPATLLDLSGWYFHEYWNHFHNSTQNIPGTIKKIFIVYGRDSGWCCISSFHLLFKSLLNIPRGPSTARISLH